MKVKEKLKTFVPPSAHAFHNHVIASGSADQQILAQLENISAQLPEILAQLAAVSKQLAENFAHIQQESKHIVWEGHDFEYNALVFGGFFEAVQNTDFEEKYLKLVNGLDEESIETTNRIISRMQCCLARNDGIVPLDLFTQAEKDFFLFLQNEYFPSILKISDNCYVYKQYKLPINQFEPCVFLDKHGLMEMETPIEQLEDKDIIDAGGFIGDSVLILSPLTKRNVYTFEPISDNYNLMQQTIAMNNVRNAVCEQMALGGGEQNLNL